MLRADCLAARNSGIERTTMCSKHWPGIWMLCFSYKMGGAEPATVNLTIPMFCRPGSLGRALGTTIVLEHRVAGSDAGSLENLSQDSPAYEAGETGRPSALSGHRRLSILPRGAPASVPWCFLEAPSPTPCKDHHQ